MWWVGLLVLVVGVWAWQRHANGEDRLVKTGRPRTLDAVDTVIGWAPEATRVLTLRQQHAMDILLRALPGHLILAQVPLSQFIKVPTRNSYGEWLRRIGHVAVDLMICDRASNVIAVIEVRASDRVESERTRKRRSRVERVLRTAGIQLHTWNEALLPEPSAVRKAFAPEMAHLQAEPDSGPETSPLELSRDLRSHSRGTTSPDMGMSTGNRTGVPASDRKEPPRSTWFDDLHATQPTQLDSVEVITHDENSLPGGRLAFRAIVQNTPR